MPWTPDITAQWQADYALVWNPPAEMFNKQKNLKAIINLGAGVDKLLALPNLPASVPIFKLQDAGMSKWMLDYVRYGVLHFTRDFDMYRNQQQVCTWGSIPVTDKSQWPIGVLGLGAIGRRVANGLFKDGYAVLGWSRSEKSVNGVDCYTGLDTLPLFLSRCKILVNLLPSTAETRLLIGREQLLSMPQGSVLISCGRGEVVDEHAVLECLSSGYLRGGLMDVFEHEPLPTDSPIWCHPNLIITPHVAAPTPVDEAVSQVAEIISALESKQTLSGVDLQKGY